MKKLLFAICLFCSSAYGQLGHLAAPMRAVDIDNYKILESANLCVTYKLAYVYDVTKPDARSTDMQILEVGSIISKYYSRYLIDHARYIKENPNKYPDAIPLNSEEGTQPYEIYKNYPLSGKMTVTNIGNHFRATLYVYEETVPSFDWKLYDETIEILGYRCQKATTSFRGRNYTAWFTMAIPVNNGPWKFGGLPGLIMKVTDSENHYDFECVGIEQPKNEIIKLYDGNYTKTNRKDIQTLYQRMHKDYVAFLLDDGSKGVFFIQADGSLKSVTSAPASIPYNPIERE